MPVYRRSSTSGEVYHVGASIKDLGKKWTAIMKMESIDLSSLLSHL